MIILGITGSIGTGKSHFCKALAREKGVVVLSSDTEVHRLYSSHKELVKHIAKHFPQAVNKEIIDRKILGELVFNNPEKRKILENAVYPLLKKNRKNFLKNAFRNGKKLVVLEIPLLFENNLDEECDVTLTLYCSPIIQRSRVLSRGQMTEEKFKNILKAQMPIHEKLKHSDFYFNTGRSKSFSARAAKKLYMELVGD